MCVCVSAEWLTNHSPPGFNSFSWNQVETKALKMNEAAKIKMVLLEWDYNSKPYNIMWHNNETKHEFVCEFTHFTYANRSLVVVVSVACIPVYPSNGWLCHAYWWFCFFISIKLNPVFRSSSPSATPPSHYQHHITAAVFGKDEWETNWLNYGISSTLLATA